MNFLQTFIVSIVEGITEFLPISSTEHLMLTARVLGLAQTDFLKTLEIAIQFGAILSVVMLYWKRLLVDIQVLTKVITAFIPTALLGLVFYKIIKTYLLKNCNIVLWSLLIGGLVLIGVFQAIAMIPPGVSR